MITALLLVLLFVFPCMTHASEGNDTLPQKWGVEMSVMPGSAINIDETQRKWMKRLRNFAMDAKMSFTALPQDSDAYADDYNYPTFSVGLRYQWNHGITMHKSPDPMWQYIQETDYDSKMGNILSAYLQFTRPFYRNRHWEWNYSLGVGAGYSKTKYNLDDEIDNELIGSRWLIFFSMGLTGTYQFTRDWAVKTGVEFYHHSNGAVNRPNKGANIITPFLGLAYRPYYQHTVNPRKLQIPSERYLYLNFSLATGFHTLLEEWQLTQFYLTPDQPDYRKSHFPIYHTYAGSASLMWRYTRRWASGIGLDAIYADYTDEVDELNQRRGFEGKAEPWSIGLSLKHEVFYHRLSLAMSLGFYLKREMGEVSRAQEQRYYERIGLNYEIPYLRGMKVGACVKAHRTKADLIEVSLSMPLRIKTFQ